MKRRLLKTLLGDLHVTRSLILLLAVGGLYALALALSQTFVNVYIWKQSQDFFAIGLYHLAIVLLQSATYVFAGKWTKTVDRIVLLRLGVFFLAVFFFIVLSLGENMSHYLLLLGAILGVGYGFYWLAFDVLTFEMTEPDTRDFFNGFLGLLTSFSGMIGPFTAGLLITKLSGNFGYHIVFTTSFCLFFTAVVLSFFIEKREFDGQFSLKPIFVERKNNAAWRSVVRAHYFQGWRDGTFAFIITILIYVTTASEWALGIYGLITSAISLVIYLLAAKMIVFAYRKKAILIGGALLYVATLFIVVDVSFRTILFYGVLISFAYPILLVPYTSMTYDVIGKSSQARERRVEYVVVRELFLNLGRVTSIVAFLLSVHFFNEELGVSLVLLVLGIGHLFVYFSMRNVHIDQ